MTAVSSSTPHQSPAFDLPGVGGSSETPSLVAENFGPGGMNNTIRSYAVSRPIKCPKSSGRSGLQPELH